MTTFASTIVWKPFCNSVAIAARVDFSGPHLFLDALEDDDVRIGRDSDREDQAEAGQRQRDVEDEDRRVHERDVDGGPVTATIPSSR